MDQEIKKLVVERYEVLPQKIQEFLLKPTLTSSIRIVAQKHNLPEAKATTLENEVVMTLLGFEPLESFDERIMKELLIPGSVAASIERDLKETVFHEVEDELLRIEKEQKEYDKQLEKEGQKPQIAQAPAFKTIAIEEKALPPQEPAPLPSYAKPLTEAPRYTSEDPYRERPQ